jgi:hypothetical protein
VQPPACGEQRVNGRLTNALCDAFSDEEDDGEAGIAVESSTPPLEPHGPDLSVVLRSLRRRLKEYLGEQSGKGKTVALRRGASGGLYPTMEWTIQFGKWLGAWLRIEPPSFGDCHVEY